MDEFKNSEEFKSQNTTTIETIYLRVQEGYEEDKGRPIARICPRFMKKIGLIPEDIIEIRGTSLSAGYAIPIRPEDENKDIVRIDKLMFENCGVKIDDLVEIRKADVQTAEKVVLRPFGININANRRFNVLIKRNLRGLPITINDLIIISRDISKEITFVVINLFPKGVCVVDKGTKFYINTDIRQQFEFI